LIHNKEAPPCLFFIKNSGILKKSIISILALIVLKKINQRKKKLYKRIFLLCLLIGCKILLNTLVHFFENNLNELESH